MAIENQTDKAYIKLNVRFICKLSFTVMIYLRNSYSNKIGTISVR